MACIIKHVGVSKHDNSMDSLGFLSVSFPSKKRCCPQTPPPQKLNFLWVKWKLPSLKGSKAKEPDGWVCHFGRCRVSPAWPKSTAPAPWRALHPGSRGFARRALGTCRRSAGGDPPPARTGLQVGPKYITYIYMYMCF